MVNGMKIEKECFLVSYIIYLIICMFLFWFHVDEDIDNTIITAITVSSAFFATAEILSMTLKFFHEVGDAQYELYFQMNEVRRKSNLAKSKYADGASQDDSSDAEAQRLRYLKESEEFTQRNIERKKEEKMVARFPFSLNCGGLIAILVILTLRWSGDPVLNNILTTLSFALLFVSAALRDCYFKQTWKEIDLMRQALKHLQKDIKENG